VSLPISSLGIEEKSNSLNTAEVFGTDMFAESKTPPRSNQPGLHLQSDWEPNQPIRFGFQKSRPLAHADSGICACSQSCVSHSAWE
jgi:hypothetical protein